ncbi:NAD(P)-dependent oxidoreductase [Lactobacillus gallinarum]|jgi:lactate dehydrogenase-like 2-hydroxyacid dehydrogenase|uniref:Dihydrofolate reductase n=2 Tax=Lactobacillus gallinarum TaxID=52242 RepID=A0A1Y4UIW5_9LACO|nr:NAD(P)-dependent oxidoreductase [Lactobacillus gallinarum]MDM8276360.1 NAD(P)-dependent oxidoreductase [Lactobacillus gallinarum]OUQ56766.1 dihydrofolate reductase [Lactobacillus gallinarum]OUQ76757.1 dihydrofolate reductase [Lactobacillus gallinarum]
MSKAKILVLGGLRDDALTDLKEVCDITIGPVGHRPDDDRQWVLDHIAEYDGVIVAKMIFDKQMIDTAKNLKIISTYGVGFDHVDTEYAKENEIVVSNCPESVLRPTAELALTMILASARRIRYYDHTLREGVFLNADEYDNQGYSIEGKTLGILGMGRIGQQVARFAKALGMKVIYHNRHQLDEKIEAELDAKYVDFDELIKNADFLSLHAPATDETYHIINADVFKQMKDTAFLINVARGSLVDSDALISALKNDEIAGAALDVFENEPHPRQELVEMDNVIMTPHVGSATHVARFNLSKEAANNVLSFFKDGKAINQIN